MWDKQFYTQNYSWETKYPEISQGDFTNAYTFWMQNQNVRDNYGQTFDSMVQSYFEKIKLYPKANLLHNSIMPFAAQQGNEDLVQFLIETQGNILETQHKNQALFLAVENNHLSIAKRLVFSGADINQYASYNNQTIQLHILADQKKYSLMKCWLFAEMWKQYLEKIGKPDPNQTQIALDAAIEADHKPLFLLLLKLGCQLDLTSKVFPPQIETFLNYQPSQRYLPIKHYVTNYFPYNASLIANYIEDEANTTEEESSDEQDDNFILTNPTIIQNDVTCVARGMHYCPSYWKTSSQRKTMKTSESHQKDIYSIGTEDIAHKRPRKANGEPDFVYADLMVKMYFESLKITEDKEERNKQGKKVNKTLNGEPATFENLFLHLVQTYVNSYSSLFNEGGAHRNFNAITSKNTLLSTSPCFDVVCRYSSGERVNHTSRFFGKLRRSTGEFKHHRLGYVEVYLIDKAYMQKYATDIQILKNQGKIGLNAYYSYNQEIIIESSIPKEYVLGFQLFSLPKMKGEWHEGIAKQYGLSSQKYNEYKSFLRNNSDGFQVNDKIKALILEVTEHQANRLNQSVYQFRNVQNIENLTGSFLNMQIN